MKKFKEEIPENLRNEKLVGEGLRKFNFFSRIVRDKNRWGKVERDADDVDSKNPNDVNKSSDENKKETIVKSIKNLNKDCFEYISKNKDKESIALDKKERDAFSENSKDCIADRFNVAVRLISKGQYKLEKISGSEGLYKGIQREDILHKEKKAISTTGFIDYKNLDVFNTGDPKSSDCLQAMLADCWWQSGIISLLQTPDGKEKIKEIFTDLGGGKVLVRLFEPGNQYHWRARKVIVDKKIPALKIYNTSKALWVHLLQQAMVIADIRNIYYEKMRGESKFKGIRTKNSNTYGSLGWGRAGLAWHAILGDNIDLSTSLKKDFKNSEENNVNDFYDQIKDAISESKAVTISFNKNAHVRNSKNNSMATGKGLCGEYIDRGLVFSHEYTIVDCSEENGTKYIWLINPWFNRRGVQYDENTGKRKKHTKKYSINEQNKDGRFKLKARTAFRYLDHLNILNSYENI